ncbi:hypothetical protein [Amorphus sp. 3PC139-8]|uniref:hypothetical protein n=1 Tax=Amorphus sp. 3PC139-8 TaxID=2735676 RepID=UPI00345DD131
MTKGSSGPAGSSWPKATAGDDVTADLARLMARDLVFVMRFLGESQYRLQQHFHDFIAEELARQGFTKETHPLIGGFVETHALVMRDFVFSGVALTHQVRIDEMERLLGDTTSVLRVDIWDQLRGHIDMAERQFKTQAPGLERQLEAYRAPSRTNDEGERS